MVEGNTQHKYKEAITMLEESSPGTKHHMYFGFLKRAADRFQEESDEANLVACSSCGAVTWQAEDATGDALCAFCKMKALAARRKVEGVPAPTFRRRKARGGGGIRT